MGQPVPGIEVEIRAEDGTVLGPGEPGELFVRGDQVSGKYTDIGSVLDEQGWFPTKDVAYLDAEGYLFIGGVRTTPSSAVAKTSRRRRSRTFWSNTRRCAIARWSAPTTRNGARSSSRWWCPSLGPNPMSKTCAHMSVPSCGVLHPDRVVFRAELPTNATGKVLRRELVAEVNQDRPSALPAT